MALLKKLTTKTPLTSDEIVEGIVKLTTKQANFWKSAHGWAPAAAANLMNVSRLDRQVSLARCLNLWVSHKTLAKEDGALILAWANLGSLIEGSLKLFLAVWYETYKSDVDAIKDKTGNLQDPDGLMLERLRVFFAKKNLLKDDYLQFILKVQQRRNAIHAFQEKNIGSDIEFYECLEKYLDMAMGLDAGMPYPE